jgi:hypothetical protein
MNMFRKKGDPTDIVLFLVIIFFLTVSIVITLFVNNIISEDVISGTVLNSSSAYESINESFTNINEFGVQRTFIFIFALFIIGILISSFLIRVHPVFLFLYIIMLAVTIFVSIFLANSYATIVDNPLLAEIAENYEMMTWVMQHIVKILIGVGALSMIIIFGKIGGGGDGSQQDI